MHTVKRLLAWALIVVGLLIAAFPFISVAQVQREVLEEVPLPAETLVLSQNTFAGALFDSDFVLASRVVSAPIEDVEAVLLDSGFGVSGREFTGNRFFSRECCGNYDAVLVSLLATDDGATAIDYTVFDDGVVYVWWFISGLGILVAAGGRYLLGTSRSRPVPALDPASPPKRFSDVGSE